MIDTWLVQEEPCPINQQDEGSPTPLPISRRLIKSP